MDKKYYLVAGVQYDIDNNKRVRHCITCAISPNEASARLTRNYLKEARISLNTARPNWMTLLCMSYSDSGG